MEPNRALDFGRGFYTTLNETQAEGFARKVMDRLHSTIAIVNVYEADLEKMKAELQNVWFDSPNEAWLDYVSNNRNGMPQRLVISHLALWLMTMSSAPLLPIRLESLTKRKPSRDSK